MFLWFLIVCEDFFDNWSQWNIIRTKMESGRRKMSILRDSIIVHEIAK